MSDTYKARRQSIEDRYRAQQEAREIARQRQEEVMDSQLEALARQRESASRDAYVRQQQQLVTLPEELAAYGINGGGAETSLLKIHTEYNKARDRIRSDYEENAGVIEQDRRTLASEYEAGLAEDRADYYDRLAQLAADIAEAQAAEQARREEMELAWAKLKQQERLAMAKLEAAQNKNNSASDDGKKEDTNKMDGETSSKSGIQQANFTQFNQQGTRTRINGQIITNAVTFDGSGQYRIQVGDRKMTQEELDQARMNGEVGIQRGTDNAITYVLRTASTPQEPSLQRWLTLQGLRK